MFLYINWTSFLVLLLPSYLRWKRSKIYFRARRFFFVGLSRRWVCRKTKCFPCSCIFCILCSCCYFVVVILSLFFGYFFFCSWLFFCSSCLWLFFVLGYFLVISFFVVILGYFFFCSWLFFFVLVFGYFLFLAIFCSWLFFLLLCYFFVIFGTFLFFFSVCELLGFVSGAWVRWKKEPPEVETPPRHYCEATLKKMYNSILSPPPNAYIIFALLPFCR